MSQREKFVAIGKDPDLDFRVTLNTIYNETDRFINQLAQCVRECKRVDEASRFARWLQFSGILNLLDNYSHDPSFRSPMCDFRVGELNKKAQDLVIECGDLFRAGKADPKYSESDIAEINRKLDLVLSSGFSPASGAPLVIPPLPSELKGLRTSTE